MSMRLKFISGLVCTLVPFAEAVAEVTLVGGSILNGNFNAGDSSGVPTLTPDPQDFDTTPDWMNFSGASTQNATDTNQFADGTRNAVLFDQPARNHGLDTGYTIQSGDVFNTSYNWRTSTTWDIASDQVGVTLFTTSDDTINGTRTDIATDLSGLASRSNRYLTHNSNSFYTAETGDAGKRLFVELNGIDGNASNGFARVDDFELSTGAIGAPTPSLEFNAALNPMNGTDRWDPNIDALSGLADDANPIEFFTFAGTTSSSPVNDASVPGITASYSAGSQGRFFHNGTANQNGNNYIGQVGQDTRQAPVTFEVWFKPNSLTGGDQLVAEWGGSGNGSYISLQNDTLAFHTWTNNGNIAVTLDNSSAPLTTAEWTQVLATWDSGAEEAAFYINGQLVDSTNTTLNFWSGGNAFGLGQRGESDGDPGNDIALNGPLTETAGTDFPLDGEIGIYRLYRKALDDIRVLAAYDAVAAATTPGDADGDGDVDGTDFLMLQRDNAAGIPDWESNYGTENATASINPVPEPSTALLICAAVGLAAMTGRKKLNHA